MVQPANKRLVTEASVGGHVAANIPARLAEAALDADYAAQPQRGAPVTTATTVKAYNPGLKAYNLKPSNTRKFRAALQQAVLGTGICRVALEGDSTTFGQGAGGYANSYPAKFRDAFNGARFAAGQTGPVIAVDVDTRWVFTGTWQQWAAFKAPFRYSAVVGDVATFASDKAGTVIELTYLDEGLSTFTVSVDGGAPVTVNQLDSKAMKTYTVTGLANTTHTIAVTLGTRSTGTNTYVAWAAVHQGYGTLVGGFGISGSNAGDHINTGKYYADAYVVAAWKPHLTILDASINDSRVPTAIATYKTNMQTIITLLKAQGDVILHTANPIGDGANLAPYTAAIYELADTNDLPVIDMTQVFGGTYAAAIAPTNLMSDTLHPNAAGYTLKANALNTALVTLIDTPTLV